MQLDLKDIPRVKRISKKDFIEHYFIPQKPVVIERFIEDWPAYTKWNLEYIKKIAGDREVPLFDDRPINAEYKFNEPHRYMKMSAYLDILQSKPTTYRIFLYNLLKEVPALQDDYTYPDIGLKFLKKLPFLFFGGENAKVFMHYDIDYANIFHFHFHGKKQCILYPPSETPYLYKIPHALIAHQDIDFTNPDLKKWPALQKAKGYVTELSHGETLYMPEGYWHHMTYLTPGFSMSIRSMTRNAIHFTKGSYNFFIMRHFDNIMRRIQGEKWITYKNKKAIKQTHHKNSIKVT